MKIKFGIILGIIICIFVSFVQGTDIQFLSKPGPERDELRNKYEEQIKSGNKDINIMRKLGIIYHFQANESEKIDVEMIKKSYKTLKKVYRKDKNNVYTLGYYGSITTMMALTTDDGMRKSRYVKTGIRKMDKAIRMEPDNIDIRLLRGFSSVNLPKFFQRARYTIEDLEYVIKKQSELSPEFKAKLYFNIGLAHEIMDNVELARKNWKKAVQVSPKSPFGKKARERIE